MSDGRMCLIIPHIVANVDRELINGIFAYLKEHNYDLFIITGISSFEVAKGESGFIDGMQNIYSLLEQADFDGILFAADYFTNQEIKQDIYQYLINRSIPVLVLEEKNDFFPYIYPEQRQAVRQLTNHLIWEHNCSKIYFLAGLREHHSSHERQLGFEDAMRENSLPFTENDVFYGDFWKEKPAEFGRKIAYGEIEKPDAIVCASDIMALSLIESLTQNGIKVPEDVKITGYDGITDAFLNNPPLTTVCYRNYQFGYAAAEKLYHIIYPTNTEYHKISKRQKIRFGTSCGCSASRISFDQAVWHEIQRLNSFHFERYIMMGTDFFRRLTDNDTIEELMLQAASFSYRIPNWKSFCVCLCEDWNFVFSDISKFRKSGYSNKMMAALEKTGLFETADFCKNHILTSDIIPKSVVQDSASVYLLTSLHSNGQIFGYLCTSYDNPEDIYLDANYCNWCDALNRGIQEVQRKMYRDYIRTEFDTQIDIDPETGFFSRSGLIKRLPDYIAENENCAMILMQVDDEINNYPFNPISLISSAIQKTKQCNEIVSRINQYVFAIVFPFDGDEIDSDTILQRADKIENSILQYETYQSQFYIILPYTSFSAEKITKSTIADIESAINDQLIILNHRLYLIKYDSDNYRPKFYRFRQDIKRNLRDNKPSIDEAAKYFGFSKSHFQRVYTQIFGRSFSDDIINIRIDRAKQLLSETNMKIKDISNLCGYENESYFMRQFRNKVGMTAVQFRKNSQGKNMN